MSESLPERLAALGVEACDDGTWQHHWRPAELGCEDCGDHSGFMCEVCCVSVDYVWQSDAYEAIADANVTKDAR